MNDKKKKRDIESKKKELLDAYKKQLDEIFDNSNFNSTFDEIEKFVDSRFEKNRNEVIESRIERDANGISADDNNPDETCLCRCGTGATLCRDEKGDPKIIEREMKTKHGMVRIKEYGYYCSRCRNVFFPSARKTKAIRRKL